MPHYQIVIKDGGAPIELKNEYASIDEARMAATRAALSHLLSSRSQEPQRVASVEIADRSGAVEAHFQVTLELTDFI